MLDYYRFRAWLLENWDCSVGSNMLSSTCPLANFLYAVTGVRHLVLPDMYYWDCETFDPYAMPSWAVRFETEVAKVTTDNSPITGKLAFEILERVTGTPDVRVA